MSERSYTSTLEESSANGASALDEHATRHALRSRVVRCFASIAIGAPPLALGVVLVASGSSGLTRILGLIVTGFAIAPIGGGLGGLFNAARMRRLMRSRPWTSWGCRYQEVTIGTPNGEPTLVLLDDRGRGHLLTVPTWMWRWPALRPCDGASVLFIGDPDRGGVVATPDREHLFWARRPFSSQFRNLLWGAFDVPGASAPGDVAAEPAAIASAPAAMERAEPMPGTLGWRILQSLWIPPTLALGFLSWASFAYAGLRVHRQVWIAWGVAYLVAVIAIIAAGNALDSDAIAGIGSLVVALASFAHALVIRQEFLRRLWAQESHRPDDLHGPDGPVEDGPNVGGVTAPK